MSEKIKPKHATDWLVNGKIPAGSVCPFRAVCHTAKAGDCGHTGTEHTVPFSCGTARAYNMTVPKTVEKA